MKLLLDMNLSPRWCEVLAGEGFDATHWSAIGAHGAADREIMDFAAAQDFVILTHDLDFGAILAASKGARPSVVQMRTDDISPEAGSGILIQALSQFSAELRAGALLTIDVARTRLTLLPLRN